MEQIRINPVSDWSTEVGWCSFSGELLHILNDDETSSSNESMEVPTSTWALSLVWARGAHGFQTPPREHELHAPSEFFLYCWPTARSLLVRIVVFRVACAISPIFHPFTNGPVVDDLMCQLQLVHQQAEEALDPSHQEKNTLASRLLRGAHASLCRRKTRPPAVEVRRAAARMRDSRRGESASSPQRRWSTVQWQDPKRGALFSLWNFDQEE